MDGAGPHGSAPAQGTPPPDPNDRWPGTPWLWASLAVALLCLLTAAWLAARPELAALLAYRRRQATAHREQIAANCSTAVGALRLAIGRYTVDEIACVGAARRPRMAWLSCYRSLLPDLHTAEANWRDSQRQCAPLAAGFTDGVGRALAAHDPVAEDLRLLRAEMNAAAWIRAQPRRRWPALFRQRITPLMRQEAPLRPGAAVIP